MTTPTRWFCAAVMDNDGITRPYYQATLVLGDAEEDVADWNAEAGSGDPVAFIAYRDSDDFTTVWQPLKTFGNGDRT